MPVRKSVTRRRRRAREPQENYAKDEDVAARGLWKELEDERRRGTVQALNVKDGALVVYYVKEPVETLPSKWMGYRVVQELYRKPESELVQKGKSFLAKFLDVAEKDPERVLRLAEGAVDGFQKSAQFVQENPAALRNAALAFGAKFLKKRLERG